MIVVAHPDDETIGMGAQLCRFKDALLVQVTDGAPRDGHDANAHGYSSTAEYATARRVELTTALEAGEARGVRTEIVGISDREACFDLVELTGRLLGLLRTEAPDAIFVLAYEGGHPDHDAASFAVNAACRLIEARGGSAPGIIEMTGYHADSGGLVTGVFLPGQHAVATLTLTAADRLRKKRMIDCFASQRKLLAGFAVETESSREAPQYNFTPPTHRGELHYERLRWKINGCAVAAASLIGSRPAWFARMPKRLTVLNIAYPFAPVGSDTAGGAEQVLSAIDRRGSTRCVYAPIPDVAPVGRVLKP
jgi:LmbE family N-acetylglucosaminyl deacetylase